MTSKLWKYLASAERTFLAAQICCGQFVQKMFSTYQYLFIFFCSNKNVHSSQQDPSGPSTRPQLVPASGQQAGSTAVRSSDARRPRRALNFLPTSKSPGRRPGRRPRIHMAARVLPCSAYHRPGDHTQGGIKTCKNYRSIATCHTTHNPNQYVLLNWQYFGKEIS
jgi:hypothetical protein